MTQTAILEMVCVSLYSNRDEKGLFSKQDHVSGLWAQGDWAAITAFTRLTVKQEPLPVYPPQRVRKAPTDKAWCSGGPAEGIRGPGVGLGGKGQFRQATVTTTRHDVNALSEGANGTCVTRTELCFALSLCNPCPGPKPVTECGKS